MQDRSFLQVLSEGYDAAKELIAINNYKKTSELYQKALIALNTPGVDQDCKDKMTSLNKAITFADMIKIAVAMDPATQPIPVQLLAKSLAYCGSFFKSYTPTANFVYYAFQLREDITTYAVKHGFSTKKEEEKVEHIHRKNIMSS